MGVVESLIMEVKTQGLPKAKAEVAELGSQGSVLGKILGSGALLGAAGIVAVGAAAVGAGILTAKMAGDFQAGLTSLVTGAGEAQSNIALVRQGILQMAVDTATSTKQLTDGMYMIESAGFHGAAGLDILKAAAEGAKVGNADLGVVADATTTIMKDFGNTGITATQSVNLLVATVANGKTHMQDLAGSMAQILPVASAAHVKLTDVAGAMATMTGEGVPAAQAATYLRQTILALDAPGSKAKKTFDEIGLSASDVAKTMQTNLPEALKMITDAVGKKFPEGSAAYVDALKNIAGGSRTMQGILDLTGQHMRDFTGNVNSITDAVKKGGKEIQGWSDVQGDFNFQIDRARQFLSVFLIQVGTVMLPILTNVAKFFNDNLSGALKNVVGWLKGLGDSTTTVDGPMKTFGKHTEDATQILIKHKGTLSQLSDFINGTVVPVLHLVGDGFQLFGNMIQWAKDHMDIIMPILAGLAASILVVAATSIPALVIGFIAWAGAAAGAAIATIAATWPVLAIAAAIGILVGFLIYAYNHWGWFRDAVNTAKIALGEFGTQVGIVAGWIGDNILPKLGWLKDRVLDLLPSLDVVKTKFGDFLGVLSNIKDMIGWVIGKIGDLIGAIGNIHIPDIHIPGFASGTEDAPGGFAKVHRDEVIYLPAHSVVRNPTQQSMWGGGSEGRLQKTTNIHNHFYASMDGTLAARVVAEQKWQATLHGG